MSDKDKDANVIVEGMKALRESIESKHSQTGEALEKQDKITKDLGDAHEKLQKEFEDSQTKEKENQAKVDVLKEQYDTLYKQATRLGLGSEESEEKALYTRYSGAMNSYIRKGIKPSDEILDEIAQNIVSKNMATKTESEVNLQKSLLTGINPDGGYLVFPDRRTDIQVNRIFETSPVRSVSRIITTTSDQVEIIINDNEFDSGGWVGEITTRPSTETAKFGRLTIHAHEQFAQPEVSQKMLDDSSINVEALINDEINKILTRTENTAFVIGDGAAKPRGFLDFPASSSPDTYERGTIEQVPSGVSGAVKADGIITLFNRLKEEYTPGANFFLKRRTWGEVLKLKDGQGNYLLNFEMLPEGAGMLLMGKRVLFADDIPDIAADSLSIVYGNFSVGYTIVDRLGIRILRDPFTNKPLIKFYTTKRVGGDVTNYEAIKIQKLSAT